MMDNRYIVQNEISFKFETSLKNSLFFNEYSRFQKLKAGLIFLEFVIKKNKGQKDLSKGTEF